MAVTVQVRYDKHNNPIVEKTDIEPLPVVDHSSISYPSFRKDFYKEAASLQALPHDKVLDFRRQHNIRVQGGPVPKPLQTFEQAGAANCCCCCVCVCVCVCVFCRRSTSVM